MLQRLERSDRDAELPARLEVLERVAVGGSDRAHRLGANERCRKVDDLLDQRQRTAGRSEDGAGGDADVVEPHVGCARAVEHAQRRERDARCIAGNQQQAQAVGIRVGALRAHGHDEFIGHRGMGHRTLDTREDVVVTVDAGAGCDVRKRVVRAGLHVREGEPQLPARDSRDQTPPLIFAATPRNQSRTERDRSEPWLDDQRVADRLHQAHRIQRASIQAAIRGRQREAEQAELGECAPDVVAAAGG